MINIYSPGDISKIREGGRILADVLQKVLAKAAPGATTLELDQYANQLITSVGGRPSFKMERGYAFATCMCVNDMVVHGLPGKYKLQSGDILGIDAGVFFQGFHTDASWSAIVGDQRTGNQSTSSEMWKERKKFLEAGKKALNLAMKNCVPGNHIGDISKAIQDTVESAGYSCVRQLVGHGVGRQLHEDPEIPCYLRGRIENTPVIQKGMVLAIEVIYNQGSSAVVYANDDGWTIVTKDSLPSGLFEHTVAITEKGPEILTLAKRRRSEI